MSIREKPFQREAEAEAQRLGLLWHHCADPRKCRGPAGFPDLVVLGAGGLGLAELKTLDGQTSAGQDAWIWALTQRPAVLPALIRRRQQLDAMLLWAATADPVGDLIRP